MTDVFKAKMVVWLESKTDKPLNVDYLFDVMRRAVRDAKIEDWRARMTGEVVERYGKDGYPAELSEDCKDCPDVNS